jgi:hypothetical protein
MGTQTYAQRLCRLDPVDLGARESDGRFELDMNTRLPMSGRNGEGFRGRGVERKAGSCKKLPKR